MFFFLTVFLILVLDLMWWRWADQRLRPLASARLWRWLLGGFMSLQLLCYATFMTVRIAAAPLPLPTAVVAGLYLWHLLVLPATMLLLGAATVLAWIGLAASRARRLVLTGVYRLAREAARQSDALHHDPALSAAHAGRLNEMSAPSRRQMLSAAAVAIPPLLMTGSAGYALSQLDYFRVRSLAVNVPGLPPVLDGLRIVHISDLHIGRFTPDEKLAAIVQRTNALQPDLVAMTGDLIDFDLEDLPKGIDMLRQLKPRYGLFVCEGNHDLIENRDEFEIRMLSAGMPLLLNDSRTLEIGGQPVQILGLRWGRQGRWDAGIESDMAQLLRLRQPEAFQMLLTHHPHAFDPARQSGIPLTLSGHTHGGQLMLTRNIGAGPLMFRYWSGLYQKAASSLVVSNGAGNWFPLRINAPMEIGHITLRRA